MLAKLPLLRGKAGGQGGDAKHDQQIRPEHMYVQYVLLLWSKAAKAEHRVG